jgi:hypothetical protein
MTPQRSASPATTLFSTTLSLPALPVVEGPSPFTAQDEIVRSVRADAIAPLSTLTAPIASPRGSTDDGSAGNQLPADPSPPAPSLPAAAIDALATASGGAGSVLLLALLVFSLLLAPTFASKLRMHAGNCRPAPFVSLLERPG